MLLISLFSFLAQGKAASPDGIGPDDIVVPLISGDGGHLLVEAVLDEYFPVTLILDTGAPNTLLTAGVAEKLGHRLSSIKEIGEGMVLNGPHRQGIIRLESIELGDLVEENIWVSVLLDYDEELEESLKDGLLGLDFLKRYHFSIDKENNILILKKD